MTAYSDSTRSFAHFSCTRLSDEFTRQWIYIMSARKEEAPSAEIVDMTGFLNSPCRKRVATIVEHRQNAVLLSIREKLAYKATLGINDLNNVSEHLSKQELVKLNVSVRHLLDTEFGHLRVHRHRDAFAVSHQCLESLIAGLLRVQFHARKIDLLTNLPVPAATAADSGGTVISWGVGATFVEAESERLRRKSLTHS